MTGEPRTVDARPLVPLPPITGDLQRDLEQFLYAEAELLDTWRIEEWFQLFTEDCVYWVPSNTDDQEPETAASIIYDRWSDLRDRMARLLHPLVYTQQPRARTRRLVSNVRVGTAADDGVQVFSNFLLFEVRLNRERLLGGQYEHHLRREGDTWRIAYKKIALLSNDSPVSPISLLL
jgi:3-phenylpropionate/cinnamic acid dioxygenase small subunit